MSFGFSLFPLEFIKKSIATYEADHGKRPKLLVVSNEDWIGYAATYTLKSAQQTLNAIGISIITGDYLNSGEFDLAMGIKEE